MPSCTVYYMGYFVAKNKFQILKRTVINKGNSKKRDLTYLRSILVTYEQTIFNFDGTNNIFINFFFSFIRRNLFFLILLQEFLLLKNLLLKNSLFLVRGATCCCRITIIITISCCTIIVVVVWSSRCVIIIYQRVYHFNWFTTTAVIHSYAVASVYRVICCTII